MQTMADVLAMPIAVAACDQTCALGGAILGATAAGAFPDVPSAMAAMAAGTDREYRPDPGRAEQYGKLYERYKRIAQTPHPLTS